MREPLVTVFGSGEVSPQEPSYQAALELGKSLAEAGIGIVTGGYGGIMEAALKGAAPYAVRKIGVLTAHLAHRRPNPFAQELLYTHTYLERLQRLLELADGYAIFPGGSGTLLELFALWALSARQLLPPRPAACVGKVWEDVLALLCQHLPELGLPPVRVFSSARDAADYLLGQLQRQGLPIRQQQG